MYNVTYSILFCYYRKQFVRDEHMLIRTPRHNHFVDHRVGAKQSDYIEQYPDGAIHPDHRDEQRKYLKYFNVD